MLSGYMPVSLIIYQLYKHTGSGKRLRRVTNGEIATIYFNLKF